MSKETQPQTKKPIFKKWWFWVGIVVVVGIIGSQAGKKDAGASGVQSTTKSTASTGNTSEKVVEAPKEAPPLIVTAKDYYDAYESNEVSADAKYKGKTIAITGEVDGVSKTFGIVSVNLKAAEYIKQIRCKLKEESDAASLTKGQTITLVGVGDGKTMFPEVEDCRVRR